MTELSPETRDWILRAEGELRRLPDGFEATRSVLVESVGNFFWHSEDPACVEWFQRALELRAHSTPEPGPRSGFLYWKLGMREQVGRESQEMRARNGIGMNALRAMARERPLDAARMAQTITTSYLLAEDPEAVRLWAGAAIEAGIEPEPHGFHACRELAGAMIGNDGTRMNQALAILHRHFPVWPMYEPEWVRDVFRFALSVREVYFPDLPLPFGG